MTATGPLYCYRWVVDRRGLALLARDHGHPMHSEDTGYLLHALLAACLGKDAPSLFSVDPDGRRGGQSLAVLAYGTLPWDRIVEQARAVGQIQAYNAIIWDESACKPMPENWKVGASFRYSVHVCPVRRQKRASGSAKEVDAFLVSPSQAPSDNRSVLHRRQAVYEAWLREQVEGRGKDGGQHADWQGGASIESSELSNFRLSRFIRHDAARNLRPVPDPKQAQRRGASGRPDAVLTGVLTIVDSARFGRLLIRGIGRHRAFGFGMLLLKRN